MVMDISQGDHSEVLTDIQTINRTIKYINVSFVT